MGSWLGAVTEPTSCDHSRLMVILGVAGPLTWPPGGFQKQLQVEATSLLELRKSHWPLQYFSINQSVAELPLDSREGHRTLLQVIFGHL